MDALHTFSRQLIDEAGCGAFPRIEAHADHTDCDVLWLVLHDPSLHEDRQTGECLFICPRGEGWAVWHEIDYHTGGSATVFDSKGDATDVLKKVIEHLTRCHPGPSIQCKR